VAVERPHVIPDGEPGQDSVSLAGEENPPRVFLQLNGADAHMAKKQSAEDSAAGSGEEMQFTKWNIQFGLGRFTDLDRIFRS